MLVLDTHVWWWGISEPEQLSPLATESIRQAQSDQICVASISLWEFAMMVTRGRIRLNISPQTWFEHAIHKVGTRILELIPEIALDACTLPGEFHKDPADRIIVATARVYDCVLMSIDQNIVVYPHVKLI
jgi:PIN domain nuclease of toxin-antitoxin system